MQQKKGKIPTILEPLFNWGQIDKINRAAIRAAGRGWSRWVTEGS